MIEWGKGDRRGEGRVGRREGKHVREKMRKERRNRIQFISGKGKGELKEKMLGRKGANAGKGNDFREEGEMKGERKGERARKKS